MLKSSAFSCSIFCFICSGVFWPTCEFSCLMKIVCLLRCSGSITGEMLILLKCSMARVEVKVSMACESSVLAKYSISVGVSLVSGISRS